jgi:diguanylate cyclase (GGDEF)-like protein
MGDSARRHDPLTGLLDRDYIAARLTALLADRSAQPAFGVLFIDVNDFKGVNDRFGHIVGDQVIREVAGRLASCMRGADRVVRYGGDEFVVVFERTAVSRDGAELVDRIHSAMAAPVAGPEGDMRLSVSIGAAMATPEMRSPEDLLAAADRAMYAAKRGK